MELFGAEVEPRARVRDVPQALALRWAWIGTPLGRMLAVTSADGSALQVLDFEDRRGLAELLARLTDDGRADGAACAALLARVERAVGAYFQSRCGAELGTIALSPVNSTAFHERVWAALREIPAGQTRSYAELAERLRAQGVAGAVARSVARANGANFLAIVTPCHRVIGADGSLTGYGGGLERKRWLLGHEGRGGRA
jgi:AraC family transcriptional regulator of adaptative response/methylated-DNA-[protein]-cysteine methyltransferase